jgi:WD40 repeat protein
MKEKCGGQFDHIDQTLDPQDNSFLKQRIIQTSEKILKLIKKIQKQSKILILKIENESNQLILSLTSHLSNIQKFSERKKFSKSELPSLKTFLKAHHEIHLPDFKSIEDQITICYRQEIIKEAGEEDWQTFSLRNFFAGHQGGLWCGVIDYSRDLLITGSYDSIIRIYDLQKHSLITTIEGHKSDIRCLALAGENFLSGSNDKTIKIWETDSSFHKGELLGHRGCVYSIQVFQLNTKVLSASRAKEIICWDLKLRTQIFRVETENVCWCLKVIKDSSLAFVSVGTSVKILKIFNAEIGGFIDGFERSVKCFEVTDDEKFIVCGNFDGSVKVFEVDHVERC